MTETTKPKTRTISLTDHPPVRIREDQWPVIAMGSWDDHDGQVWSEANTRWGVTIRVRQHEDGRAIVYGVYDYDTNWRERPNEWHRVGVLLDAGADVTAAIQTVGAQLIERLSEANADDAAHIRDVIDECIHDLPAVDL